MADRVREPIQVYLTVEERAELDRCAGDLGVSRSEALRRGILALRRPLGTGPLRGLAEEGSLTPPQRASGAPPRGRPVAPLARILEGLARDREER
ncbi:MAG TPA: ribbon-helix-helix protein, CopG family [Longimicrobiales bacterium]|nr:ribbon-helix-helix protein, CopG family [Longimicrobiales bacterium]